MSSATVTSNLLPKCRAAGKTAACFSAIAVLALVVALFLGGCRQNVNSAGVEAVKRLGTINSQDNVSEADVKEARKIVDGLVESPGWYAMDVQIKEGILHIAAMIGDRHARALVQKLDPTDVALISDLMPNFWAPRLERIITVGEAFDQTNQIEAAMKHLPARAEMWRKALDQVDGYALKAGDEGKVALVQSEVVKLGQNTITTEKVVLQLTKGEALSVTARLKETRK